MGKWVRLYNSDEEEIDAVYVTNPADVPETIKQMEKDMEEGDSITVEDEEI